MRYELTLQTNVDCTNLVIQPDGDEFTIGDPYHTEFLRVPLIATEIIKRLDGNTPLGDILKEINAKFGEDVDIIDFMETLLEYGLIYKINNNVINTQIKREPKAIYKKMGEVFFSLYSMIFYFLCLLSICILLVLEPQLIPKYQSLFLFDSLGLNALNLLILAALLKGLHEFGHFLAAAKENVLSNIRFNLRMIWLVIETDMTGLWAKDKKARYIPFLAGMLWDITLLFLGLSLQLVINESIIIGYLQIITFIAASSIIFQFIIFLRTDLYFVLINWKNASSLEQHSILYLKQKFLKKQNSNWKSLPQHEKKTAIWFSYLYVIGGIIGILGVVYFQVFPTIHVFKMIWDNLSNQQITSFYFWDSIIIIGVILVQSIPWLFAIRNNIKDRKERDRERQRQTA
jgi:putative peptide zinc metalloprotease protein